MRRHVGEAAVSGVTTTPRADVASYARTLAGRLATMGLEAVLLSASAGVLLVAAAYALSRSGQSGGQPLYWLGLVAITVPAALFTGSRGATRAQRIAVTVAVTLCLYAVKLLLEPFAFLFSDELVHYRNAVEALTTGALFSPNSVIEVTASYPGLAALTGAVSSLTGLGIYGSGILIVGAARLVMTGALFLILERATSSQRVAALATVIYAAAPNYLYWSAQYSYQSLALPLGMVVVFAALMRTSAGRATHARRAWTGVALIAAAGVVTTHHLTGVAVSGIVVAVAAGHRYATRREIRVQVRRGPTQGITGRVVVRRRQGGPLIIAVAVMLGTILWATLVAPFVFRYLDDIFSRALGGVGDTVGGSSGARTPFQSDTGGPAQPVWERLVGLAAVGCAAVCIGIGLVRLPRRRRAHGPRGFHRWRNSLGLVLAALAALYLALLPLRLVPDAWETANRSSDVLYIGVAFMIAVTSVLLMRRTRLAPLVVAPMVAVLIMGGVLGGWPPDLRLAPPYRVATPAGDLEPQGRALATWAAAELPPHQGFVADESNGRLLMAFARQDTVVPRSGSADLLLGEPVLSSWELPLLRKRNLPYIVVDRRTRATSNMAGYFFRRDATPEPQIPTDVRLKWAKAGADRVFDSGDIVVYDVRRLLTP